MALSLMPSNLQPERTDRYQLIIDLLKWFKYDFFSWMDKPSCNLCESSTISVGMVRNVDSYPTLRMTDLGSGQPTVEDKQFDGHRVELYKCTECSNPVRFVRYNDVGKLLQTRTGRCGEWANCFTLCARALGFDARYVLDKTDHVWTEIYSDEKQRWLHCDPCENTCDNPLMYETGWNKKLTFCVAFSKDEVVDVTWRYTRKFGEVLKRRRSTCRENVLLQFQETMCENKQVTFSDQRKESLSLRRFRELVDFISSDKHNSVEEQQERTTGALDWRVGRGEATVHAEHVDGPAYVFKSMHDNPKSFKMQYFCAKNKYVVYDNNEKVNEFNGWQGCVNRAINISRKEELDWKMVYLARCNAEPAELEWVFEFPTKIKTVSVNIHAKTYEQATVTCCVGGTGNEISFDCDGDIYKVFNDFNGSTDLKFKFKLSGGSGDQSWQHSQLFRQSMNSDEPCFCIEIDLL